MMSTKQLATTRIRLVAGAALILAACSPPYGPGTAATVSVAANSKTMAATWESMLLNPHDRQRRGKDCGGCMVTVRIWPIQGNYTVNPQHPPVTGVPVAKVKNLGNVETEMYGFKPGVDTYFVVDDQGGSAVWALQEVTNAGTFHVRTDVSGPYVGCGHIAASAPNADFKTCLDAAMEHGLTKGGFRLASSSMDAMSAFRAPPMEESPGWASCTEGCCTMGAATMR
jgi:hypothetical protein